MGIISDKIGALQQFQNNMFENIRVIINEYEYVISDMNTQDQLYERGIDRNGVELAEDNPYAFLTMEIKRAKNHPYNRVTLRDEGDFHRSFKVEARFNELEIYATDIKAITLAERYGYEIYGLTDENINELIWEYIKPELYEQFIKSLS